MLADRRYFTMLLSTHSDYTASSRFQRMMELMALGMALSIRFSGSTAHTHGAKQHTAFAAKSCAEVDTFYAAGLQAGGTDNCPPGLRDPVEGYPQGYYAAFLLDPDGNNIEAVFRSS
jgi:catechol 2,3-dioxygenase-like lactoylglutathione lyase family enzyme